MVWRGSRNHLPLCELPTMHLRPRLGRGWFPGDNSPSHQLSVLPVLKRSCGKPATILYYGVTAEVHP